MSELIWVAVPGGTTGSSDTDQATLRVVITPQLDPGPLTGGMASWPPTELTTATLLVEFAASFGGPVVASTTVPPPHIQAQDGLWAAFFTGAVVQAQTRRVSAQVVDVDRTSQKAQAIDTTLSAVAATDIPAGQTPVDALNPVAQQQLRTNFGTDAPQPSSAPPTPATPPPFVPPDFDRTLALLREHPQVLRRLGLIIELTLPMAQLPHLLTGGVVRVSCQSQPTTVPHISAAWTHYSADFLPAGATSGNIDNGMVTLTDAPGPPPASARWMTATVDVDNGAKRLKDAAIALGPAVDGAAASPSAGFALPALRSNGIALVRIGRQGDFDARRERAAAFARRSLAGAEVTADDLVLGYRVDVRVQGRDWQSLNVRNVDFYKVIRNGATVTVDTDAQEEGHIKAHAAVDDGRRNGRLRADEVVARWTGWSFAVPRPDFAAPADPPDPAINPLMPYEFRWKLSVPDGTLPPLRFGTTYQLRARVADIAGGGLKADDPLADRCFTDLVTYLRYEPIASPTLSLPANVDPLALAPGEAVDHLVVRSDADAAGTPLGNNSLRVLTPPLVSLTLVEQHGAFDSLTPEEIRDRVLREQARQTSAARGRRGSVSRHRRRRGRRLSARRARRPGRRADPAGLDRALARFQAEADPAGGVESGRPRGARMEDRDAGRRHHDRKPADRPPQTGRGADPGHLVGPEQQVARRLRHQLREHQRAGAALGVERDPGGAPSAGVAGAYDHAHTCGAASDQHAGRHVQDAAGGG